MTLVVIVVVVIVVVVYFRPFLIIKVERRFIFHSNIANAFEERAFRPHMTPPPPSLKSKNDSQIHVSFAQPEVSGIPPRSQFNERTFELGTASQVRNR